MNPIFLYESGKKRGLNTNLVAYYKLDSDSIDATGLSPNGTATGIDYVAGKTGNAARFNAAGDKIEIADTNNLSFTTGGGNDVAFSISLWVYYVGFAATGNWLLNKRQTISGDEWQLLRFNDGKTYMVKMTNSTNYQQFIANFSYSLNTWYHLVITDDGSKTLAGSRIYVNSVSQSLTAATGGTYTGMQNTTALTTMGAVGYATPTAADSHNGYIEDVGIWKNRVLNQSEVNYLYNSGNGRTYPF